MKRRTPRATALCMAVGLTACATYQPSPIELRAVLDELEAVEWAAPDPGSLPYAPSQTQALGPRQLAAFAIVTNPSLKAVRAEWDVSQALLVEAGLLPDPEFGWDSMNVVAALLKDSRSSSADTVAGYGLLFPFLRPGELDAREDAAKWRVEEVHRRILAAEWDLTRQVFVSTERYLAAQQFALQIEELTELMGSTSDFFQRAKDAGAVTAIEANLALGEYQAMRLRGIRVQAALVQERQAMNALLGLPPGTVIEITGSELPSMWAAIDGSVEDLTSHAIKGRPDLAKLMATYQVSEQELRLAVAQQYPAFSLGTAFQMTIPVFSKFGKPAIATAQARREQLAREFKAAIHSARQEIAAAHLLWRLAQNELDMVEDELLPNAEQTLDLSRQSLEAGEITLLETLALQRALVDARMRRIETRAARAEHAWNLLAASGWLLTSDPAKTQHTHQSNEN